MMNLLVISQNGGTSLDPSKCRNVVDVERYDPAACTTSNGSVPPSSVLDDFSLPFFHEVSKEDSKEVLQTHSDVTSSSITAPAPTRRTGSREHRGGLFRVNDDNQDDSSSSLIPLRKNQQAMIGVMNTQNEGGSSGRGYHHPQHKHPASPSPPPQPRRVSLTSRRDSSSSSGHQRSGLIAPLPPNFSPQPWSVIIGRDKMALGAIGSKRFRVLISCYIKSYAKSYSSKDEKSRIITEIESTIRSAYNSKDSRGAFIKYQDGLWWEVDPVLIREKIGRQLRESLHTKYSSSSRHKRERGRHLNNKLVADNMDHSAPLEAKSEPSIL